MAYKQMQFSIIPKLLDLCIYVCVCVCECVCVFTDPSAWTGWDIRSIFKRNLMVWIQNLDLDWLPN